MCREDSNLRALRCQEGERVGEGEGEGAGEGAGEGQGEGQTSQLLMSEMVRCWMAVPRSSKHAVMYGCS